MPALVIVGRGEAKAIAFFCGRCDAALARFLADPPGIALAV